MTIDIAPFILGLSCASLGLSVCGVLGFAYMSARMYSIDVELNALKKSTHKIQYMPVDSAWADPETAVNKAFESDVGHPTDFDGVN